MHGYVFMVPRGPLRIVQLVVMLLVAAAATILLDHRATGLGPLPELLLVLAASLLAYGVVGLLAQRAHRSPRRWH